jgi:hypothetical protein
VSLAPPAPAAVLVPDDVLSSSTGPGSRAAARRVTKPETSWISVCCCSHGEHTQHVTSMWAASTSIRGCALCATQACWIRMPYTLSYLQECDLGHIHDLGPCPSTPAACSKLHKPVYKGVCWLSRDHIHLKTEGSSQQ